MTLAEDVVRGVYANDAEFFQRDLDSFVQGQVARYVNVMAWAQNQLRIMSEMAADRSIKWVADESERIRKGLEQP
jgi:hypothetical protein